MVGSMGHAELEGMPEPAAQRLRISDGQGAGEREETR